MGLPARLLSFRRVADRVPLVRGFGAGCPLIVRAGPHWPHGASARASTALRGRRQSAGERRGIGAMGSTAPVGRLSVARRLSRTWTAWRLRPFVLHKLKELVFWDIIIIINLDNSKYDSIIKT